MQQSDEAQLATLFERVDNLIKKVDSYVEQNERRHLELEAALNVHITNTLPIINSYLEMKGERKVEKAGWWLMAIILAGVVIAIVVDFIQGR